MTTPVFPPSKEGELATWTASFLTKIETDYADYGLTEAQVNAYRPLSNAYVAAYAATTVPETNSKAAIIAKNDAKHALLRSAGGAWELVDIIQAYPGTTDTMRGVLGLRIKDVEPTPVAPPANPPVVAIVSLLYRTVRMKVRDITDFDRRAKPAGVEGATILYHVGPTAPLDPSQWTFLMNSSKTTVSAQLPAGVPAGATVWFTAIWFNARKQTSGPAVPQSVVIGGDMAAAA